MSVTYRGGTLGDADSVGALFRTGFTETFAHLYDPADLADFLSQYSLDRWRSELADPSFAFRLAESDGSPVGYVKLGLISLPVEPSVPALELKQLYVAKDWHGGGVAAELMDWAIAEARARAAKELYLSVYTENWRARRFYERFGFEFHAPYVFMVGKHEDEDMIMRLEL
jgi:ribosomal protein S18 acetylase RimI-like enzyme